MVSVVVSLITAGV